MHYTVDMRHTKPSNFRLTLEAIALLTELSRRLGISRAAIMELLIREKAKAENIAVSQGTQNVEDLRIS